MKERRPKLTSTYTFGMYHYHTTAKHLAILKHKKVAYRDCVIQSENTRGLQCRKYREDSVEVV